MSTQTLRHLCDAMDALALASDATYDGLIDDTIEAAQANVKQAMRDAVDAFEANPSATDQASWREGYEAALEDFDITEEDVAAHKLAFDDDGPSDGEIYAAVSAAHEEPRDDLYDAICGLFEAGAISRYVLNTLIEALEDGGKPAVIAAADNLRAGRGTDAATHLAIMAAVQ